MDYNGLCSWLWVAIAPAVVQCGAAQEEGGDNLVVLDIVICDS